MSKYLAKILGNDPESLQMIAALSSGATVKVSDIKYLSSNKVFLLSIERMNKEKEQDDNKNTLLDARNLISEILTLAAELQAEIICKPS